MEECNAHVEYTRLGYSSCNGLMSAWLHLDYGNSGQGFGGWVLDGKPLESGGQRSPEKVCGAFIAGVLKTLEVEDWEKLPRTPLRVRHDHGKIHAIGHFLKDQWFDPEVLIAKLIKEEEKVTS